MKLRRKNHTRTSTVECLGKVIWWDPEAKKGVFLSKTRGLVAYDLLTNVFSEPDPNDPLLPDTVPEKVEPQRHKVFGDVYLLLKVLEKSGLLEVIKKSFPDAALRRRVLFRCLHSILGCGSRIPFDCFLEKSFLSRFAEASDAVENGKESLFYAGLSSVRLREDFFKNFAVFLRAQKKLNGKCAFVAGVVSPCEILDPSKGSFRDPAEPPTLPPCFSFVLDPSGMPLGFNIYERDIFSMPNFIPEIEDSESTLGLKIGCLILKEDVLSEKILSRFSRGKDSPLLIARIPLTKEFPTEKLFREAPSFMGEDSDAFLVERRLFYGKTLKAEICGLPTFSSTIRRL